MMFGMIFNFVIYTNMRLGYYMSMLIYRTISFEFLGLINI